MTTELMNAVANLIQVKGRHHTEQAYARLIKAYDAVQQAESSRINPAESAEAIGAKHYDDYAVDCFAKLMKEKLAQSRAKGRSGWNDPTQCSVEYLNRLLLEHVKKGDPVDVANFCMMLRHYNANISVPASEDAISKLLAVHADLLEENPYCYFELAYTQQTEWGAFICDKPANGTIGTPEYGANRKIIAQGFGPTPEEACIAAITAHQNGVNK